MSNGFEDNQGEDNKYVRMFHYLYTLQLLNCSIQSIKVILHLEKYVWKLFYLTAISHFPPAHWTYKTDMQ